MSRIISLIRTSPKFWWYLMNFWTVVVFVGVVFNFIKDGVFENLLNAFYAIYIALLAIYAGDKEFERWHNHHSGRHPGEIFVVLWTLLIVALAACEFIYDKEGCGLTSETAATYIGVLSILAITRRSRSVYEKSRRRH